jgi:hypothetical protein
LSGSTARVYPLFAATTNECDRVTPVSYGSATVETSPVLAFG